MHNMGDFFCYTWNYRPAYSVTYVTPTVSAFSEIYFLH